MRGLLIPERITPGNGNAWTQNDNVFTIDCVILCQRCLFAPFALI